MANIYRAIKIWNGSAWDYIYPSVGRSITFGISADVSQSGGDIYMNSVLSATAGNYFDHDTSIAALNSGKIKLLKAGRYAVFLNVFLSVNNYYGPGRIMILIDGLGAIPARFADSTISCWNTSKDCFAACSGMKKVAANTIIKAGCNCLTPGAYTFRKDATFMTVAYLGE